MKPLIAQLKELGLTPILLTGDATSTAERIATEVPPGELRPHDPVDPSRGLTDQDAVYVGLLAGVLSRSAPLRRP